MCYLHIVSIFPALTETFVLREARQMREAGWNVILAPLRPVGDRPTSTDFEDLRACVDAHPQLSLATIAAFLFYCRYKPAVVWRYVKLVVSSLRELRNLIKLAYILLVSVTMAYRLRTSGVAHVHGHHLHSEAVAAMFVGALLDVPYSFKCYTVKVHYPRSILYDVVRNAAFIIADTLQVKSFLHFLGADASRIQLLRNAVPLKHFPMRAGDPETAVPIILAVGRLDYKKGFHVLFSACSLLHKSGVRFRCVVVGDGEQRQSLLDMRSNLELQEQIHMVGKAAFFEVQDWLQQSTVIVVPSVVAPDGETDGLPTVVIEAFARGVPVVGTDTAGIPEVVEDNASGFVVRPNSPSELAVCIREVLGNRNLRGKIATAARRVAESEFDLEQNAKKFGALIRAMQQHTLAEVIVAGTSPVPSASRS
jgi:colanic acid/amylovoran biosynthesis glycosyltransferase